MDRGGLEGFIERCFFRNEEDEEFKAVELDTGGTNPQEKMRRRSIPRVSGRNRGPFMENLTGRPNRGDIASFRGLFCTVE